MNVPIIQPPSCSLYEDNTIDCNGCSYCVPERQLRYDNPKEQFRLFNVDLYTDEELLDLLLIGRVLNVPARVLTRRMIPERAIELLGYSSNNILQVEHPLKEHPDWIRELLLLGYNNKIMTCVFYVIHPGTFKMDTLIELINQYHMICRQFIFKVSNPEYFENKQTLDILNEYLKVTKTNYMFCK